VWQRHPPERLKVMKAHVEELRRQSIEAID
jgi:hypothetical protein